MELLLYSTGSNHLANPISFIDQLEEIYSHQSIYSKNYFRFGQTRRDLSSKSSAQGLEQKPANHQINTSHLTAPQIW